MIVRTGDAVREFLGVIDDEMTRTNRQADDLLNDPSSKTTAAFTRMSERVSEIILLAPWEMPRGSAASISDDIEELINETSTKIDAFEDLDKALADAKRQFTNTAPKLASQLAGLQAAMTKKRGGV